MDHETRKGTTEAKKKVSWKRGEQESKCDLKEERRIVGVREYKALRRMEDKVVRGSPKENCVKIL